MGKEKKRFSTSSFNHTFIPMWSRLQMDIEIVLTSILHHQTWFRFLKTDKKNDQTLRKLFFFFWILLRYTFVGLVQKILVSIGREILTKGIRRWMKNKLGSGRVNWLAGVLKRVGRELFGEPLAGHGKERLTTVRSRFLSQLTSVSFTPNASLALLLSCSRIIRPNAQRYGRKEGKHLFLVTSIVSERPRDVRLWEYIQSQLKRSLLVNCV